MKHLKFLALLILSSSCHEKARTKTEPDVNWSKEDSISRHYQIGTINKVTGEILGNKYHAFCTEDKFVGCITNSKNDTLFKDKELNPKPEFRDLDQDGITDVLFKGNIKDDYDLIKYDSLKKRFRKVKNFNQFPDPVKIADSKYFYSYHSAGCADECWESDLFYIVNFQTVRIGNISKYYNHESESFVFTINKVQKEKPVILETLNEISIEEWEQNKFESIKNYWIKNYHRFIK